jgi:hypothetical protein
VFPPSPEDRVLVRLLRHPEQAADAGSIEAVFARAEVHGLAGVLFDRCREAGLRLAPALARSLETKAVARQLEHDTHLAKLEQIDHVLERPTVVLKGPLLAERFYDNPSSRGATDIDLLVALEHIGPTSRALSTLGYASVDPDKDEWSLREHHHILLGHPHSLAIELHFHGYRGFGSVLPSEPLIASGRAARGFKNLRTLAPENELVYLAVHAASHRFGRLAWLYDLSLLLAEMTPSELAEAHRRAHLWGFGRVLALAAVLLTDLFEPSPERVRMLGRLDEVRIPMLYATLATERRSRLVRSASGFVYRTLLSDSFEGSINLVRGLFRGRARRRANVAD